MKIEFTVYGTPQPAGNTKGIPFRVGNKLRVNVVDANKKKLRPWKALVQCAVRQAYDGKPIRGEAFRLECIFWFLRPVSHFGRGRNSSKRKATAPHYHIIKPDLDKLVRAIGDALTGLVWHDDSCVTVCHAYKRYGNTQCVQIAVETLGD